MKSVVEVLLSHLPGVRPLTPPRAMAWSASLYAGAGAADALAGKVAELEQWLSRHEGTGGGVWS